MVFFIFWSIVEKTFEGIFFLWRFMWINPLLALTARFSRRRMVKDTRITPNQESNCWEQEDFSRINDCGNLIRKRLSKAETEIQFLKSQLAQERTLWEGRFHDLRRKQQIWRKQIRPESFTKRLVNHLPKEEADGIIDKRCTLNTTSNNLAEIEKCQDVRSEEQNESKKNFSETDLQQEMVSEKNEHCSSLICSTASQCDLLEGHVTPRSSGSRTCSSLSSPARLESPREKNKVYRVFVPHSHLDVHVGHRVRVLLPSGRISTGTIQFLGFLSSLQDFRIGVELESPEYGQHDGVFEGQRYFHCKPGHGVFVSFNKLLMAWE